MKSSVIIFPGSNCDRDMDVALKKFGFKNTMVWHNDDKLPKSDLIVLPGGFSYGDYLRCGSIAGKSKIINSVIDFAKTGGLVLGICNGFQILTETGLLPGVLLQNKNIEFICKNVFVKINDKNNKYFNKINQGIIDDNLFKDERIITTPQSIEIKTSDGQEVLNFCSNNYLGLANHPTLIKAAKSALDNYGFGVASVRFICGTQDLHLASYLQGAGHRCHSKVFHHLHHPRQQ